MSTQIDIAGLSEAEAYERIADGVRAEFLTSIREKRTPMSFRCNVQLRRNHATGQWDTAMIDPTGRGFLDERKDIGAIINSDD